MGAYHFEQDGGGEQSYGTIYQCTTEEMKKMLESAKERGLDLVPIMDAECDVVMITTQKIADLLMPFLNDKKLQPLDALNYKDGKVPEDVLESRKIHHGGD
jgi:hypothetical protein